MPNQLLEAPSGLTREDIVNALITQVMSELDAKKQRVKDGRAQLKDLVETDRDTRALRQQINQEIAQADGAIVGLGALATWLESRQCAQHDPLTPGNIWLLSGEGKRLMWFVHDPSGPIPGAKVSPPDCDSKFRELFDIDEFWTISPDCGLYQMLLGKDIREGAEVIGGIHDDPDIYRLDRVL